MEKGWKGRGFGCVKTDPGEAGTFLQEADEAGERSALRCSCAAAHVSLTNNNND